MTTPNTPIEDHYQSMPNEEFRKRIKDSIEDDNLDEFLVRFYLNSKRPEINIIAEAKSPAIVQAKAKLLAWRDKAVAEAVEESLSRIEQDGRIRVIDGVNLKMIAVASIDNERRRRFRESLPLITQEQVESNTQFGWFVEYDTVKQVVNLATGENRIVGRLTTPTKERDPQ